MNTGTLVELERRRREPWAEPIRRPWDARPSRFENVAVLAVLVLFLVCRSDADAFFGAGVWVVPMAMLFALAWIARLLDHLFRRQPLRRTASEQRAWLVFPIALVIGLADVRLDLAFRTRLALSTSALRVAAEAATGAGDRSSTTPTAGLFRVPACRDEFSVVRFQTTRGWLGSEFGLAYAPDEPPQGDKDTEYRHVWGPWWVWVWSGPWMD